MATEYTDTHTHNGASRWATKRVAARDVECGRIRHVALISSAAQKYPEMTFKFKINADMDSQFWLGGWGWGSPGGVDSPVNLPDMLMKVSGREVFSPLPLVDDGRKLLLCVVPDQSRSQNAAYCHFKVAVRLHATPVKCPSSCSWSCSPEN